MYCIQCICGFIETRMFCHSTEAVPATVAGAKWHGTQVDGAILSLVIALPLPAKLVTFDLQNMHKWIGGPAHEWANLSAHGYCETTIQAALAFFVDKKLLDHQTWFHHISQNGLQIKELWRADQDWKAESSHFPGGVRPSSCTSALLASSHKQQPVCFCACCIQRHDGCTV